MSANPPIDANAEIKPLTSLRFIAALLVVLHHVGGYDYGTLGKNIFEAIVIEGHLGVTIFFALSGFLITYKYFSDPYNPQPVRARQYIVRRIARIFPLYFFLLGLGFLFVNHPAFDLATLLPLTLTQGYFIYFRWAGIPSAWSLTSEETFYLSVPLFFWLYFRVVKSKQVQKVPKLALLALALGVTVLALNIVGRILYQVSSQTPVLAAVGFMYEPNFALVLYHAFFFRAFDFAVGMFCAYLYRYALMNKLWKPPFATFLAMGMAAVALVVYCLSAYLMNINLGVYKGGFYFDYPAAVSAGLLILALTIPGTPLYRALSFPLSPYLGRISYALYLVQSVPLPFLATFLDWTGAPFDAINWLKPIWLYIRFSLISALLYHTVERNGHRLVMRLNSFAESQAEKVVTRLRGPVKIEEVVENL